MQHPPDILFIIAYYVVKIKGFVRCCARTKSNLSMYFCCDTIEGEQKGIGNTAQSHPAVFVRCCLYSTSSIL